ncbi:MAG TPA: PDR/VanB family oxidoreductase [Pseudolabrys sp.]|nr:PDR/VanB family oxidoreductase [Pseudolabrys sp.]
MAETEGLLLTVTEVRTETPLIRSISLARPHREPLPSWQPGAHIRVRLPNGEDRSYSLINLRSDPHATTRPDAYRLGVRLEDPGTGGSRFMHALKAGDRVGVLPPANNFPLEPGPQPVVLLAGGIGITPIMSMAAALTAEGRPYRLHYAGRARDQLAFVGDIEQLCGKHLSLHTDDMAGTVFDVPGLFASLRGGEPVYCCGPRAMIDAALAAAKALGWENGRLRFELFTAAAPQAGDQSFEVVLKSSSESFLIPAGKSILDVLIEAGKDPLHDCKRGDCGICQVQVLEGVPDHRDYILSDAEKAEGKKMQICVSRSKTARLVIDL